VELNIQNQLVVTNSTKQVNGQTQKFGVGILMQAYFKR